MSPGLLICVGLAIPVMAHEIHEAAEKGDLERVKKFLAADPQLLYDNSGAEGRIPLHCAIRGKHSDVARFLIDQGADVNAREVNGASVLNYASYWGLPEIVQLLIEKGADVKNDVTPNGITPLHWASSAGHSEIVKILIVSGADANADQAMGLTPLHMAVSSGHVEVAELLLAEGAEINGMEIVRLGSELENESAFLVKVDGLVMYHGGDYYFREGGNDKGDMAYLAAKYGEVDMAFVESGFRHICDHTINKLRPRVMFPMHARGNEIAYKQYADESMSKFPEIQFICAENRGDRFFYRNGKIE